MSAIAETASPTSAVQHAAPPVKSWQRRFMRNVLYGSEVDRDAKARARVGLAIVAFAAIYFVIALRLVMFGIAFGQPNCASGGWR